MSAGKLNHRSGIHTETGFGVAAVMVVAERTLEHVPLMLAAARASAVAPVDFSGRNELYT